jgi:hypothetical protein
LEFPESYECLHARNFPAGAAFMGHAFRRCVRAHVRQAVKTCRAERKADKAAFKTKYGNEKGKHAFRRCVRQHEADPVA